MPGAIRSLDTAASRHLNSFPRGSREAFGCGYGQAIS